MDSLIRDSNKLSSLTILLCFFFDFHKCSVYCGIGEKTRDVWCGTKNGEKIAEELCADEHKPRTRRSCNKRRRCGEWESGMWSEVATLLLTTSIYILKRAI